MFVLIVICDPLVEQNIAMMRIVFKGHELIDDASIVKDV